MLGTPYGYGSLRKGWGPCQVFDNLISRAREHVPARWRHVHRNHQTVLDDVPQSDPAAFLRQIQTECFHLGLVLVVVMIHSHYIEARSQYAG